MIFSIIRNKKNKPISLEPKEILFLYYMNGRAIDSEIAGYWTYTYNLNKQKTIDKFFKNNLLGYADIQTSVTRYKVSELKSFLSNNGVKSRGKKQDLINTILNNFSEEKISSAFTKKFYQATDIGEKIISENDHIIYFHKKAFNVPIDVVQKEHKKYPSLNKYELAIKIFDKEGAASLRFPGVYRCTLYSKSLVYHDIKNSEMELKLLLQVCYLDLFALPDNADIEKNTDFLAPFVIAEIISNDYYNKSTKDELKDFYISSVMELPINYGEYNSSFDAIYNFIKD